MVAEPCIQLAEDADAVDQAFRDLAVMAKHQAAQLIQGGDCQPGRMGGVVAKITGAGKITVGLIPPSGILRVVSLAAQGGHSVAEMLAVQPAVKVADGDLFSFQLGAIPRGQGRIFFVYKPAADHLVGPVEREQGFLHALFQQQAVHQPAGRKVKLIVLVKAVQQAGEHAVHDHALFED